jgi:hypothetical protein
LTQFNSTRSFLCQILAHYLVYLGSQLRLPFGTHVEQFILAAAPTRWNKEGLFQWSTAFEEPMEEVDRLSDEDSDLDTVLPRDYNLPCHPYQERISDQSFQHLECQLSPLDGWYDIKFGNLDLHSDQQPNDEAPWYATTGYHSLELPGPDHQDSPSYSGDPSAESIYASNMDLNQWSLDDPFIDPGQDLPIGRNSRLSPSRLDGLAELGEVY